MLQTPLKSKFSRSNRFRAVFVFAIAVFAGLGFLFSSVPEAFASHLGNGSCLADPSWNRAGGCQDLIHFQDSGGSTLSSCQYRIVSNGTETLGWTPIPSTPDPNLSSQPGVSNTCSGNSVLAYTDLININSTGFCNKEGAGICQIYTKAIDNSGNSTTQLQAALNVDFTSPMVLATNASSAWFSSGIATLSVSDSGGSGVAEAKYSWTNSLNASCSFGGTVFTDGTLLSSASGAMPAGSNILYLCARDKAGNLGTWNGQYNIDPNPPTISDFNVSPIYPPDSITPGQPVLAVSWRAADTGGSHLQEAAIWRAPFDQTSCSTGAEKTCNWGSGPEKTILAPDSNSWDNTQNPYSYSPTGDGIYWYGIHVADKAGNEVSEWSGSGGTLSVKKVRIKLTNAAPSLSSVSVSPAPPAWVNAASQPVFTGTWTDPEQASGETSQLYICTNSVGPSGGNCSGGSQSNWCVSSPSAVSPSACSPGQQLAQGIQTYYAFECDNGPGSLCSSPPVGPYNFFVDTKFPFINSWSASSFSPLTVTISWSVSDVAGGSHIKWVTVWRANSGQGNWVQIEGSPFSPQNPAIDAWSGSATDAPGPGNWQYGIHVTDQALNEATESNNTGTLGSQNPHQAIPVNVLSPQPPNQAPQALRLQDDHATANYCSTTGSVISPPITLSWQFQDLDAGAYESAFQVQISTNNFASVSFDTGIVSVPANTIHSGDSDSYAPPSGTFSYNTAYEWKVKVWDDQNAPSSWATGNAFSTPAHYYPIPNFAWSPASPSQKEQVQFQDQTNFSPLATNGSWNWNFGDNSFSSKQNPVHSFLQNGSYSVALTSSDNAGSCSKAKIISIGIPFPTWIEISPF